jgi:septal ring factor EnvC (AmiA/AmiB activator)
MDPQESNNQPDQPQPEMIDTRSAETPAVTEKEAKQKPGGLQRFFRKALIWLVVIAISFSAGIATYHFLRYKPLAETLTAAQSELDQAQQDLNDLQADIDKLKTLNQEAGDEITALETEKIALQDELEKTITHLELFQVLVDVSSARVALFLENIQEAKTYLINTQQRLDDLLPRIAEYDPALAQDMPQRLNLIISGLDRDTETAKIDLELITKDLLDIEKAVFGD